MNVEVGLVVDDHASFLEARPGRADSQRISGLRVDADHVRALGDLAAGEAHDDAILAGHRRHVDAVVRQVSIVVEDYVALLQRTQTHRHFRAIPFHFIG